LSDTLNFLDEQRAYIASGVIREVARRMEMHDGVRVATVLWWMAVRQDVPPPILDRAFVMADESVVNANLKQRIAKLRQVR
jgi:hypothetical protein